MKKIISFLRTDRQLLLQFALVFFAFFIMTLISSIFGTRIVNKSVASYGEATMNSAIETITAYLGEYKTILDDVAFSIERSKNEGADIDEMQADLASWTSWIMGREDYESFLSVYCAVNGKVIDGQYVEPPEGYIPESRPWYIGALEKNGETHYCDPYADIRTGEIILTVSKLMIDENGAPFGVIAIDAYITSTADFINSLHLLDSGYGILLDTNRAIVIHPDNSLVNTHFEDINGGLGGYTEISSRLAIGKDVSAFQYTSYTGIENVAFFKELFNGWYVGIISPSSIYFNDIYVMIAILAFAGLILTALLCVVLAFLHIEKQRSDEANKIKSSFLANMSHEIRTPMNAIIGMTDLLLNEPLSNRQQGYVKDINISSHSLLGIINDILDLSKIESGKLELNPVDFDFHTFIDNISSMFRFASQKKGLEFKFETDGDLPKCLLGDDIRLRQVLTNICGNAVKFTNSGFVRLKVITTDETLMFEIEDTGIGIRKEDLPKLYNAFVQADAQKTRKIKGTGLGLAISKSFVEMMGGKVTVDSVYGQGTIFTVIIPKVIGDESAIIYADENENKKAFFAPKANVLVVDDNEVNLKVASGLLNLYKIKATTASSGQKAIDLVTENDYDLVFMDHMMPEMDGVKTTSEIRKLGGKYKKLTIIALTANAIQGAKQMFMSNGFNGFISKPIEINELAEILRDHLPSEKIEARTNIPSSVKEEEENNIPDTFLGSIGKIASINTEIGLSRVSGMEDMYRETLELFTRKLLGDCARMEGLLAEKDIHNFSVSVHGIKSSLATIGAMELSEMAFDLEKASKNDDLQYCEDHCPEFFEKLRFLHSQLYEIIAQDDSKLSRPEGDKEYLMENIRIALDAAAEYNGDLGIETISKLLEYDYGEQTNEILDNTNGAFQDYDFGTAITLLNHFLDT